MRNLFRRPKAVIAFFMIFFFMGLISFSRLSTRLLPDLIYPVITVETEYKDSSSEEVEENITDIMEKNISVLPGMKYYRSISSKGMSTVMIIFNEGSDIDIETLYTRVREKIAGVRDRFPDNAGDPVIKVYDPQDDPALIFSIDSEIQGNSEETVSYIEKTLRALPEVADVSVTGLSEKRIFIRPDPKLMEHTGLNISGIVKKIEDNNFDFPGGTVYFGDTSTDINIRGTFRSVSDIGDLPLSVDKKTGNIVYLKDVAEISSANIELDYAVVNGEKSLVFSVYAAADRNLTQVVEKVKQKLSTMKVDHNIVSDRSVYIEKAMRELFWALAVSLLVTSFIVFLFFRDLKISAIVSSVIPMAIVIDMSVLYFSGMELNSLSLSGLVLSVGLIVDSAVVISERLIINRAGHPGDYTVRTVKECILPLSASFFTTVVAFSPVVFLQGMTGEFFRQIAIAISSNLFISLMLSFFFIPSLFVLFDPGGQKVRYVRMRLLKRTLLTTTRKLSGHTFVVSVIVIMSAFLMVYVLYNWEKEYIPLKVEDDFSVHIEKTGNDLSGITDIMISLISMIEERYSDRLLNWCMRTDLETGDIEIDFMSIRGEAQAVYDGMRDYLHRNMLSADFVENPAWEMPDEFTPDLRLKVFADDLSELYQVQEILSERLPEHSSDNIYMERSVNIRPSREKSDMLGITAEDINQTVRSYYTTYNISEAYIYGKPVDIFVEKIDEEKSVSKIPLTGSAGNTVVLQDITDISPDQTYGPIFHYDGERAIRYRFPIYNNIKEKMNDITLRLPESIERHEFSGINEVSGKMRSDMIFALLGAVFLIYLILVIQYESFVWPVYIIILIPSGYIGAFIYWYFQGITLNMMSLLGLVILTGICVNSSILVLTEQKRRKSIYKAVISRLRAVIVTTVTTVAGAVSMLVHDPSGLRIPVAATVAGGMLLSWFFSLVLLPVLAERIRK